MAIIHLYLTLELINIGALCVLLLRKEYQNGYNMLMVMTFIIRGFGQIEIAYAKSIETAMLGFQCFCAGSCFLPYFFLRGAYKIFKIEIPKSIVWTLRGITLAIMGCFLSSGFSDFFVYDFTIRTHNGVSRIYFEYSKFYYIYLAVIAMYVVAFFAAAIYSLCRKPNVSKLLIHIMMLSSVFLCVCSAVDFYMDLPVSTLSFAYLVLMFFTLRFIDESDVHDIQNCITETDDVEKDIGFIVFDNKFRYIKSNEFARNLYPELESLIKGQAVPLSSSAFFRDVMGHVHRFRENRFGKGDVVISSVGDRKYAVSCSDLVVEKKHSSGVFVMIIDVTEKELYNETQRQYRKELEAEIKRKQDQINAKISMFVLGTATLVDSRDSSTGGHVLRTNALVSELTRILQFKGDYSEDYLKRIRMASAMHDLGKITIEDKYLTGEFDNPLREEILRTHTTEGAKIVEKLLKATGDESFTTLVENVTLYHHERFDGDGYPKGLKESEIPTEARVIAIPVAFDEYVWSRLQNNTGESVGDIIEDGFKFISEGIGSAFDPEIGFIFVENKEIMRKAYLKYV